MTESKGTGENQEDNFKITDRRGEEKSEQKAASEGEIPKPKEKPKEEEPADHGPIDFSTFVMSLSTSAVIHLGIVEDPHTKKKEKNLPLAKQEIDIIEMLHEKTKGNLSKPEEQLVDQALYELRMRYVSAAN